MAGKRCVSGFGVDEQFLSSTPTSLERFLSYDLYSTAHTLVKKQINPSA